MLVLLDLDGCPILECPSVHVGIGAGVRHLLGLVESSPEFMEVAELDEVPDVGERGLEDSADANFVGGGGRHVGDCLVRCWEICSWQANGQIAVVQVNGSGRQCYGYFGGSNQSMRGEEKIKVNGRQRWWDDHAPMPVQHNAKVGHTS